MTVDIHPLVSPWGRFGLYSFFIDAPEPAIVDTGIATSPAEGMAPALEKLGRRIEDVRWILLTHGHIDHVGGAHALWELTGRRAEVVIHEADADLLRSRRAHVEDYTNVRGRYLDDPEGVAKQEDAVAQVISGELEPDVLLVGGERLDLGGVGVTVHPVPGHTPGSVAYVVEGQNDVFVGDAVQIHGAANGFPGYAHPDAYRSSLAALRDLDPAHLYLGHPYRAADGTPYGVELDRRQARAAIDESLALADRIAAGYRNHEVPQVTESPYSPFAAVADDLGYDADPTLEPCPFFTTMHGHLTHPTKETVDG